MAEDLTQWACVQCGAPPDELDVVGLAVDYATGTCSALTCPSKKDRGSKRPPVRKAKQATFRRRVKVGHAG